MRYKYAAFGNIADEFNSDDDDLSEWSDSEYEDGCRTAAGLKDDLVGTDITLDDEEIVPAGLSNHDVTEEMIMNSVKHVRMAKTQRQYLQRREEEAIDDAKNNVDHSERRYIVGSSIIV
jgi:arginase family enzyme